MSLLLAHGHTEASDYPLGVLYDEAALVEQRVNQQTATEASLISAAINGAFSKKSAKEFTRQVNALNIRLEPRIDSTSGGIDDEEQTDPEDVSDDRISADLDAALRDG